MFPELNIDPGSCSGYTFLVPGKKVLWYSLQNVSYIVFSRLWQCTVTFDYLFIYFDLIVFIYSFYILNMLNGF